jgi:flagellar biosynthesis/type III secretory pathway chaperone
MNVQIADFERLLNALAGTLEQEHDALRMRDLAALNSAIADKAALVTALEAATKTLLRDGHGELVEQSELHQLAQRCAEANRVNGGAIALNRSLVTGMLNTLRGGSSAPSTYDALGKIQHRDTAHRFDCI